MRLGQLTPEQPPGLVAGLALDHVDISLLRLRRSRPMAPYGTTG